MHKRNAILTAILLSFITVFGGKMFASDYNQTENFGVKSPGDKVGFTATPPGKVISGKVTDRGGFIWTGSLAKWAGTIPDDFSGIHHGIIQGEYTPEGKEGKEPKIYTWQVDTRATVPTVKITKCPEKMLVEGTFELEAKAEPETKGQKYDWSFEGRGKGESNPDPSENGNTEFFAKEITSPASESFIKVKYGDLEDKKEVKITRCEYFKEFFSLPVIGKPLEESVAYEHHSSTILSRTPNRIVTLFFGLFAYELYDQYKIFLLESEFGKSVPYVREELTETYSDFKITTNFTKIWKEKNNCYLLDRIFRSVAYNDLLEERNSHIENAKLAWFTSLNWHASVQEGKHSKRIMWHGIVSIYENVVRSSTGSLERFSLLTIYRRERTNLIFLP